MIALLHRAEFLILIQTLRDAERRDAAGRFLGDTEYDTLLDWWGEGVVGPIEVGWIWDEDEDEDEDDTWVCDEMEHLLDEIIREDQEAREAASCDEDEDYDEDYDEDEDW